MHNVPWNLIHSFLKVVDQGSLSAAARSLGVSQPKLTRDIQALESYTQLNLFKRTTKGLLLTSSGQMLVESAQKMNNYANSFNRKASGLSPELQGDIRISVNEIVGLYLLPSAIVAFNQLHPSVNIEILITNKPTSITKREADIVLRMFRPTQSDLIAKRFPDMPLAFYAHQDYIEKRGTPKDLEEFQSHTIIGFDESMDFINGAQSSGYQFKREDFKIRTDNLIMQINLALNGLGIIVTHKKLMQSYPYMQQILEWISIPALQFWIACHVDTQYNARINEFKKFLINWFEKDAYNGLIL